MLQLREMQDKVEPVPSEGSLVLQTTGSPNTTPTRPRLPSVLEGKSDIVIKWVERWAHRPRTKDERASVLISSCFQ